MKSISISLTFLDLRALRQWSKYDYILLILAETHTHTHAHICT